MRHYREFPVCRHWRLWKEIRKMKQQPLYELIYNDISEKISNGEYREGDRIPSEKELAESYDVSRITSKKALEMLAEEGRIIRMAGKGSFVAGEKGTVIQKPAPEKKERLIGVILDGFGASFGCGLLGSIEAECKQQHFSMILRCSYGDIEEETRALDELLSIGVEGIIIMCVHDENYNSRVLQLMVEQFPVVTIDRKLKGIPLSFVGTDNEAAAHELTEYLLNKGCRNICFAAPESCETSTVIDRKNGLVSAYHAHGLVVDENLWMTDLRATLPGTRTEENLKRDLERITDFLDKNRQVEAFFAVEYSIARIIYRCLYELDLHKKCQVVCFDSNDNIMQESLFTHVHQDENEIGHTSVRLLAEEMNGSKEIKTILVPYRIIEATEYRQKSRAGAEG